MKTNSSDIDLIEVKSAERALYSAMIAKDFDALKVILSRDLIYIHSTAVSENREQYLAGVALGLYEYESIDSGFPRIRIEGATATIDGIVKMRVGEIGKPKGLLALFFTLIWVKEGGKWELYYRQATRMGA